MTTSPSLGTAPCRLRSVSQPVAKIAQAAVGLLLARSAGSDDPPQMVVIRGELTSRESVVAPKKV